MRYYISEIDREVYLDDNIVSEYKKMCDIDVNVTVNFAGKEDD